MRVKVPLPLVTKQVNALLRNSLTTFVGAKAQDQNTDKLKQEIECLAPLGKHQRMEETSATPTSSKNSQTLQSCFDVGGVATLDLLDLVSKAKKETVCTLAHCLLSEGHAQCAA